MKKQKIKMQSKKAQIQSGETIVVIILVSIMIMIGLVFATKSKKSNLENEQENINDLKAMEVAVVASNLNEIKCSDYSIMVKSCFDIYRLRAFKNVVEEDKQGAYAHYYDILGNTKLEINILTSNPPENIVLYDYEDSGDKSSSPVFIPTIVLDNINKKSYFAVLKVSTFS